MCLICIKFRKNDAHVHSPKWSTLETYNTYHNRLVDLLYCLGTVLLLVLEGEGKGEEGGGRGERGEDERERGKGKRGEEGRMGGRGRDGRRREKEEGGGGGGGGGRRMYCRIAFPGSSIYYDCRLVCSAIINCTIGLPKGKEPRNRQQVDA